MHRVSRNPRTVLAVVLGGLVLAGCAGENLFSLSASVGELGPQVQMSAPGEGGTIAPGDSIRITADVTSSSGVSSVSYRGNYVSSGTAAYTAETETLAGETTVSLSNFLLAADGQVAGQVYIVVEATDQIGGTGKDSVKVTIVQN